MKLRIFGDSIRLRLREPEVHALIERKTITEKTAFALGCELTYRLSIGGELVGATFQADILTVHIPRAIVLRWADTDQTGINADQDAGPGRSLRISIEKDFACRDAGNGESQEGAYPNPLGSDVC